MSNLHLTCYLNSERPDLLQYLSVTELPISALGLELCQEMERSLRVNESNGFDCASSGRLWEDLLNKHRLPYLLIRVADMRMSLDSKVTAVGLYDELQNTLGDPDFACWLGQLRSVVFAGAHRQLREYKAATSLQYAPSQRWRSTMREAFPYCRLQRAQLNALRDGWKTLGPAAEAMDQFLNFHCLETNVMEGTFQFDQNTTLNLVRRGFNSTAPIDSRNIIGGQVRNVNDALSILRDTRKAWDELLIFLKADPPTITVDVICSLHALLMKTSRILYVDNGGARYWHTYVNIGVTRAVSKTNVTATATSMGKSVKLQFCPYDEITTELSCFCDRFNELIRESNRDPFASAAWISHVFITIHPFEDGNGRLSRMLASVPLLQSTLPPLTIQTLYKPIYIAHHNSIRADRNGDYQMSMEMLYDTTKRSMEALQMMRSEGEP